MAESRGEAGKGQQVAGPQQLLACALLHSWKGSCLWAEPGEGGSGGAGEASTSVMTLLWWMSDQRQRFLSEYDIHQEGPCTGCEGSALPEGSSRGRRASGDVQLCPGRFKANILSPGKKRTHRYREAESTWSFLQPLLPQFPHP